LRDENAKLVTELDRTITKSREGQEAARKTEADLRQQIAYYKEKLAEPNPEIARQHKEEVAKLTAEIEQLKKLKVQENARDKRDVPQTYVSSPMHHPTKG
jgi:septal ring factor EnvC (AmiA/AmiB activator)